MHFAFPLLLLVASTICASPVHIESRGGVLTPMSGSRRHPSVSERFHDTRSTPINEWSHPDEVVQPWQYPPTGPPRTIIKRVDLSTVEVPGLTDQQNKMEAQRRQVFNERLMLEAATAFRGWEEKKEQVNGEKRTIIYIEMNRPGDPASLSTASTELKKSCRENGIRALREQYGVAFDQAHDKDKYWGIMTIYPAMGFPILLRYAKSVRATNHYSGNGREIGGIPNGT